jgi:hypothetical protein
MSAIALAALAQKRERGSPGLGKESKAAWRRQLLSWAKNKGSDFKR